MGFAVLTDPRSEPRYWVMLAVALIAAHVGTTRLIDNALLNAELG